ncbi:MAG TPA: Fe-S cluster assembly protein SufB [Myxococcota bacterium]|jgi:Fe-S cluster assembly protein SufB|nr:Fe-S cluster assembly protein SufB [Myxococcota bacterium]
MANETLEQLARRDYEWGFTTDVEQDVIEPGLSEDVIRLISTKKGEPEWMLAWRLEGYRRWLRMEEPHHWAKVSYPAIDYQAIRYYAAPKQKKKLESLDELDPEIRRTYEKLGIPLDEQKLLAGVAVDAVFDSVSVATTFKKELEKHGIVFLPFSEAVHRVPELVKQYLGSVVPQGDNFFAALNSAVFTDGSFVYIPPGVRCPMELSTYFRINASETGQFERTLIIADRGSYVSYLEGCTAPMRDENQLHAAVVELIALDDAQIKYSTVQNWYPGDAQGRGGIYNFVTKRGKCAGRRSKISWTQVETGSAITWKYPSCLLLGDDSVGEFYSVALTAKRQQADTGTKMIHVGKRTKSTIISKGISAAQGQNSYRGLVRIQKGADGARNYSQCDSLLIGDECGAHTFPYLEVLNPTAKVEHEATTSKIGEDQLFYCQQRGLSEEDAVNLIVNGFCKRVLKELPMEFAVEAQKLLGVSLEGAVG